MDHGNQNHGGHDGHIGGLATLEALFVANVGAANSHSHGGHMEYHGGTGHGGSTGHAPHIEALSPQGNLTINVPTRDAKGEAIRGYICHVSRHGEIDTMSKVHAIATRYQLIRIDGKRPGFDSSNRFFPVILDYEAWRHAQEIADSRPYDAATHGQRAKPNGWYPGATGSTSLVREYWQIGKRKSTFGKLEFDETASTYLEVSVITWNFAEAGDFETKLEVRVISAPEWSPADNAWGYRSKPFEAHQRVAIAVYTKMMEQLVATKPGRAAEILRGAVDIEFPPQRNEPEGTFAMSDDEMREREADAIAQDARDDQVARDNSASSSPTTSGTTTSVAVDLED